MKTEESKLINNIKSNKTIAVIGPELSMFGGVPSIYDVLSEPAKRLGVDIDRIGPYKVAEFHANTLTGGLDLLHSHFKKKYSLSNLEPSKSHSLLSQIPFSGYWMTGYDDLAIDAIKSSKKKFSLILNNNTNTNFEKVAKSKNSIVYLYGLLSEKHTPTIANKITVTEEDFENYVENFPKFVNFLKGEALTYNFMFLGFSLQDHLFHHAFKLVEREILNNDTPSFIVTTKASPYEIDEYAADKNLQVINIQNLDLENPDYLASYLQLLLDEIQGKKAPHKDGSKQIPSAREESTLEKERRIKEFYAERLGSALSLDINPNSIDHYHHYSLIDREDLLDYDSGKFDFFSIRRLSGANMSDGASGFVIYSESSEIKLKPSEMPVKAIDKQTGERLIVEYLNPGRSFTHAFKIYFTRPLAPGESFDIEYSIKVPGELKLLGDKGDSMSISLARVLRGVDRLKFSVVLNSKPARYWISKMDHARERIEIPNEIKIESVDENYKSEWGVEWSSKDLYRLSCEFENPDRLAYFVHYGFIEPIT